MSDHLYRRQLAGSLNEGALADLACLDEETALKYHEAGCKCLTCRSASWAHKPKDETKSAQIRATSVHHMRAFVDGLRAFDYQEKQGYELFLVNMHKFGPTWPNWAEGGRREPVEAIKARLEAQAAARAIEIEAAEIKLAEVEASMKQGA